MNSTFSLVFSTGDRCNFECKYCYVRNNGVEIPDDDILLSLDVFRDAIEYFQKTDGASRKFFDISFHGGESLLLGSEFYDEVPSYLSSIIPKRYKLSIQTNGSLINEEYTKLIKQYNYNIGVSIDGPENIHNAFRLTKCRKGSFKNVIRGIEQLQNISANFGVISVITDKTIGREKELFDFYINNGINNIKIDRCVMNSACTNDYTLDLDMYNEFLKNLFRIWVKFDEPRVNIQNFTGVISALLGRRSNTCEHSGGCISRVYTIYPNGDLYICPLIKYQKYYLGNIYIDLFEEIKGREKEISEGHTLSIECSSCSILDYCRGMCIHQREISSTNTYNNCSTVKMLDELCNKYINQYLDESACIDNKKEKCNGK